MASTTLPSHPGPPGHSSEEGTIVEADGPFETGRPALLRAINKRSVISALRQHGPMTRAGIADVVYISRPTIADVFAELIDDGLVRQLGHAQGPRGPRAALYELNSRAAWVIGLDVGRHWMRASLADLSGRIVTRRDEPTDTRSDDALLAQIGRLAHEVADQREADWASIAHITIGSPGVVDSARDAVVFAPNLPDWDRAGLIAALQERIGDRVDIENDVNLAALAELREGHGRGSRDVVYLWIGTGVGVGLILDGELRRGANGLAGEVAYLPLAREPFDEREATRRGRFEAAAAADAVVRAALDRGMDVGTAEAVFDLARDGDVQARQVVEQEARTLALGLAAILPVVDPELVILGGGVGHNGDVLLEPLGRELAVLTPFSPEIVTSALGTDAVLRGAVGSALGFGWDHVLTAGTTA